MSLSIKLSEALLTRIDRVKSSNDGNLYGLTDNKSITVLGFVFNNTFENHLPIGCKFLGSIKWDDNIGQDIPGIKESSLVHINYDFKNGQHLYVFNKTKTNEWDSATHEVINENDLWKEWVCLRTNFTLKFNVESVDKQLNETKLKLLNSEKPIFKIAGTEIVLKAGKVISGIGKNAKVSVALQQAQIKNDKINCLNFSVHSDESTASDVDELSRKFTGVSLSDSNAISIEFHSLALVKTTLGASNVYDILLKSIERNIALAEEQIPVSGKPRKIFVFYPTDLGHFISYVYPLEKSFDDEKDVNQRKKNHCDLNLSRPCLRRSDEYNFDAQEDTLKLINPHVGLKSLVKDGKQYIVKGKYAYHHYMQDNFNDDGWGCAYRSFQTLFSWYRLQDYTTKSVPTHTEIQQCLIDLGDKQKSFLNSRQWIGSTEVSMCLQYFLSVDSRIVHVTSGADMAQHGPTFAQHFTTYGTPVMIGGGVLAHTILGVDYNSQTNELKFLILDPHYTGTDDLDIIQKKGWCGWKPISFWDKKSYYNFCMPLFPDSTEY